MPIPPFDGITNVLPPHLGDPTRLDQLSPYPCTIAEFCGRFATSPARKLILQGFLDLRRLLLSGGIRGFQWVDGSFVQNIEVSANRDPQDVDVVTFAEHPSNRGLLDALVRNNPLLVSRGNIKSTYHVDHFLVPTGEGTRILVELTRYWYGLFSHRRVDGIWKGMVSIEMNDQTENDRAIADLASTP